MDAPSMGFILELFSIFHHAVIMGHHFVLSHLVASLLVLHFNSQGPLNPYYGRLTLKCNYYYLFEKLFYTVLKFKKALQYGVQNVFG